MFLCMYTLTHMHTRTYSQVLAARDEKMLQMQEQTGTLTAALVKMLQVCACVCLRVGLVWHFRLSEIVHHVCRYVAYESISRSFFVFRLIVASDWLSLAVVVHVCVFHASIRTRTHVHHVCK